MEDLPTVQYNLTPAPVWRRAIAIFIDSIVVSCLFSVLALPMMLIYGLLSGVAMMTLQRQSFLFLAFLALILVFIMLAVGHAYFIYFESKLGATLGKKGLGLKVVSIDGQKMSVAQAIYRDLVRWYLEMPLWFVSLIVILANKKRQRIGDFIADTIVILPAAWKARTNYKFVTEEDFVLVYSKLRPRPVDEFLAREYLAFAEVANNQDTWNQQSEERTKWVEVARLHLLKSEILGLSDVTVLRFFAEYCHQSLANLSMLPEN